MGNKICHSKKNFTKSIKTTSKNLKKYSNEKQENNSIDKKIRSKSFSKIQENNSIYKEVIRPINFKKNYEEEKFQIIKNSNQIKKNNNFMVDSVKTPSLIINSVSPSNIRTVEMLNDCDKPKLEIIKAYKSNNAQIYVSKSYEFNNNYNYKENYKNSFSPSKLSIFFKNNFLNNVFL